VGAGFWALPFLLFFIARETRDGSLTSVDRSERIARGGLLLLVAFDGMILPIVSLFLAFIRPTRRFALGLSLTCALGWLLLLLRFLMLFILPVGV
jgi:hypothetical protein